MRAYSIKDKSKLPQKLDLRDGKSTFWLDKRSKKNVGKVYYFLLERYKEAIKKDDAPKGYSLSRISEATKLADKQVFYAVMVLFIKKNPLVKIDSDLTPGGKPRKKIYLIDFLPNDKEEIAKISDN